MKPILRPLSWSQLGLAFGLCCGAALSSSHAFAANPTPLLPSESVSQTLYVSPSGSDNNNGSSGSPFATIQKAVDTAGTTTNTKISLANGTYRGYTTVQTGSNTLIFEAQNAGQAIISGSDPIPSPTSTGSAGVYSIPWTANWGVNSDNGWGYTPPTYYNRRRENVWVNGVRLTQRVSESSGGPIDWTQLQPGEFTVDDSLQKIFIKPPTGVTLTSSNTEVSTRGYDKSYMSWVTTYSKPLLDIIEHSNIVLRGLVVQHAATYIKFGPTVYLHGSESVTQSAQLPERVLVDNCSMSDNNGIGMEINNYREVTVKNSKFNDNGMRGGGMIQKGVERSTTAGKAAVIDPRNYLWQDCQFNRNAWRAAGSNWGDQNDTAGYKQAEQSSKNITFLRCQFNDNKANGFWQDYSGENTLLDACLVQNNKGSGAGGYGVLSEMTRGPLTIQNCVIRNNNNTGFISSGAPNVTLQNNFIYGNNYDTSRTNNYYCKELQINSDVGRADGDFTWSLSGWKIQKNTIASLGGTINGQTVQGYVFEVGGANFPDGKTARAEIAAKLLSNNNVWSKNTSDGLGDSILFALNSDSSTNRPNVNLATWKTQSNDNGLQDQNSVFTYPLDLSGTPDPTTGATINAGTGGSSPTPTPTPPNLTNRATGGMASASSAPVAGEGAGQAFDGSIAATSKWLGNQSNPSWLRYDFPTGKAYTVTQYAIASANDVPARDPKDWTLQGSNDNGTTWTSLSPSQSNQTFSARNTYNANYSATNSTAYKSYRLLITANSGDSLVQLSELQLLGASSETGNTFTVPIGSTVGFKSASTNQYVSTNLNSSSNLQANYANSVGSWEKYRVDDAGGGQIGLFSLNSSKYVSVNVNSAGTLQAGFATSIGSWEKFTWTDAGGGYIALLSGVSGKYVTVPSGGTLNGNTSSTIGTNEKFTVFPQ